MPRNSRQPARPHSSSFSFLAISLPIPFHPFFLEIKKLPSPKGREPELRVSTQFHMPVAGHTLKGSIKP